MDENGPFIDGLPIKNGNICRVFLVSLRIWSPKKSWSWQRWCLQVQHSLYVQIASPIWWVVSCCIQKQSKNILTPTRPKSHRNPTTNLQQYSTQTIQSLKSPARWVCPSILRMPPKPWKRPTRGIVRWRPWSRLLLRMCIVDIVETSLAKSYKFAHFSDQSHFTSMKNSHGSPLNDNFYEFSMGKSLPDPQFLVFQPHFSIDNFIRTNFGWDSH